MDQLTEDESGELSNFSVSAEHCDADDELKNKCVEEISQNEITTMRELALAANQQMKRRKTSHRSGRYHRKTGQIRTARETSDSEWTSSSSEHDYADGEGMDVAMEIDSSLSSSNNESDSYLHSQPKPKPKPQSPKISHPQRASSPNFTPGTSDSTSSPIPRPRIGTCWTRTSKGRYAINHIKCPPCARRKKADKCRGGPPCGECVSRGRKTAEECQEWGDGWVGPEE